jgi:hypothetical protein
VKSSHVLIIIGAGLLVAGLILAGFSTFAVTKQVLEGSTIIKSAKIEPGLSYVAAMKELPAGQQLLLSLSGVPSDAMLSAVFSGPDGETIAMYNITKTPFTGTVVTKQAGDHTLELKNVGEAAVTLDGAILNSPVKGEGGGVSVDNNPQLQSLVTWGVGILAGAILFIAGVVIMIIGAVKHFRSRKNPESVPR